MAFYTTAGSIMSVSTDAPATYDEAGFSALTWTEVGEVTAIPEHGDTYNPVEHKPIKDRNTQVVKGGRARSEFTVPMARDLSDAGQIILRDHTSGTKVDLPASFKFEYPDGSVEYTQSLVGSYTVAADGQDSVLGSNVNIMGGYPILVIEP